MTGLMEDAYSIERIRDRMQIQDLLFRLVRAVDRRDYESLRAGFHPGSTDHHGAYVGDVDGYIAFSRERNAAIPASMHNLGNILIEFVSEHLALVESYVWSVQLYPPEARAALQQFISGPPPAAPDGVNSLGCARYVDRIERRDGAWKVIRRTVLMDWRLFVDANGSPIEFPMFETSARGPEDWLYQERRALGLQQG